MSHDLGVWASKVQEHHPDTVVWRHAETLERLLEDNVLPDARLLRKQREAFVYVNTQQTRLPVPATGYNTHTHTH